MRVGFGEVRIQRMIRFESVKSVESRIIKDHPSKSNAGWVGKTCVMTKDKNAQNIQEK